MHTNDDLVHLFFYLSICRGSALNGDDFDLFFFVEFLDGVYSNFADLFGLRLLLLLLLSFHYNRILCRGLFDSRFSCCCCFLDFCRRKFRFWLFFGG